MKYRFITRAVYEADKGDNAQGGNGNSTPENDPNKAPEKPQDEANKQTAAFTQADVDRIVAERLERAKKQADTIAQKAKDDADKKALEDQGKFKELAEQAQAKVLDLESKASRVDVLEAALSALLESQRKGLPEHVIELLDGMPVEKQLEYLAKNRDKLVKPTSPEINGGGGKVKANTITDDERARMGKRVHATF